MAEYAAEQYGEDWGELEGESRSKPRYSKLIVLLCLFNIMAFTVTCLVFYWHGKTVDPVLIGFFFGCFGLEFGSLAFIYRGKLKYVGGDSGARKLPHIEIEEETDE